MYKRNFKINLQKKRIDIGILIILIMSILFFVRFIKVLKSNNERGALEYIQMLNIGMPLVGNQVYDEDNYIENEVTLKDIFIETIGLKNFSSLSIVGNEISFFNKVFNSDHTSNYGKIASFEVDEESIVKISEEDIVDENLKKPLNQSKPEVLIYHTHTLEGYVEGGADNSNNDTNIVGVGELVSKELEERYGIAVIHDKTNHSVTYNDSYNKSRATVEKYLNKYKDFSMIIDLHRDGISSIKDAKPKKININGESTAKLMFVTCQNNPRFSKTQELSEKMTKRGNELVPGLFLPITTYTSGKAKFNQDLSDKSVLIEVGSDLNTSAEARATAKYIARIIAEQVNGR